MYINFIHAVPVAAIVFSGAASATRIATAKTQSVLQLSQQLDSKLARRLYRLEERFKDQKWTPARARAFWRVIGGARGVPHLLAQARLLQKIVAGVRQSRPNDFEFEQKMVGGATSIIVLSVAWALIESTAALLFPRVRCIGARMSTTLFCHLQAEVENVLAEYQYGCS